MNGPAILTSNIDTLKTRMGGCVLGERVILRGHNIHSDLNNMDWIEYYVFGITGRHFSAEQLRLMHAMWVYTSYPDARIWNNRVVALAGSVKSSGTLGIAAALAVSEASIYGRGIDIRAINFLIQTQQKLKSGLSLAECIKNELNIHRGIAGFGRPLSSVDERIAPTLSLARELGLDQGIHMKLVFAVENHLQSGRWRLKINAGGLWAALAADLGFSAKEYYLFMFPSFLAGMPPCYIENVERPEGTLFPLSCEHIQYEGVPKRPWCRSAPTEE